MMKQWIAIGLYSLCVAGVAQDGVIPQDGLVAFYPFHGNAEDESDFDNHAEVNGATLVNDRFGASEEAYLFAEYTDIVIPHADQIDMATGDTFSWAIWVLPSTEEMGGEGSVFEKWNTSANPYPALQFRTIDVGGTCEIYSTGWCGEGGIGQVEGQIEWSAWTHVAMVADDGVQSLFINGQMVDQQEVQEYGCGNNVDITMGRRPGYGNPFLGAVDDFAIWDRALTSVEIINMHLGGEPEGAVYGCTDSESCNYNPDANLDDSSCHDLCQYCYDGTVWNEEVYACIPTDPSDYDADGCVGMADLLDLLSAFGTCAEVEPNEDAGEGSDPDSETGSGADAWSCGDPLAYQGYDYETVLIGDQCWFAENLRAENYLDGSEIATGLTDDDWGSTLAGAVTVYGEEDTFCNGNINENLDVCDPDVAIEEYGRLYNWHAVADPRGICPSSWHVPADEEWIEMIQWGAENLVNSLASNLKSTFDWSGGIGSNSLGWNGRAGGMRGVDGYNSAGYEGIWWTSTVHNDVRSLTRWLGNGSGVFGGNRPKFAGYSIRCIKDSE